MYPQNHLEKNRIQLYNEVGFVVEFKNGVPVVRPDWDLSAQKHGIETNIRIAPDVEGTISPVQISEVADHFSEKFKVDFKLLGKPTSSNYHYLPPFRDNWSPRSHRKFLGLG
jgi:hypothetical protein